MKIEKIIVRNFRLLKDFSIDLEDLWEVAWRPPFFVLECGNFGRNRKGDAAPARSYVGRKVRSLGRKVRDFGRHIRLFPWDSLRFFWGFFWDGVAVAVRGE